MNTKVLMQSRASANALVKHPLSAAQTKGYAGSVIAPQKAQDRPAFTADQAIATQRAWHALMDDPQRRAAGGDPAALAKVKANEKPRSQ